MDITVPYEVSDQYQATCERTPYEFVADAMHHLIDWREDRTRADLEAARSCIDAALALSPPRPSWPAMPEERDRLDVSDLPF